MPIPLPALRGYVLEEVIAWLLKGNGYRLLVHEAQDRAELVNGRHGLLVRGRGSDHQADALGEFVYTPAFSLPIRLFVEAKHRVTPCGLEVVRNAHGVIHDVNENYARFGGSGRLRRRYHYAYALFSATGFRSPAQEYALAHQISLVDLSGPAFAWLLDLVGRVAEQIHRSTAEATVGPYPVGWLRHVLRQHLGTWTDRNLPNPATAEADWPFLGDLTEIAAGLAQALAEQEANSLLLGFPPVPFVLALFPNDLEAFIAYASRHPTHRVGVRRRRGLRRSNWELFPRGEPRAYRCSVD